MQQQDRDQRGKLVLMDNQIGNPQMFITDQGWRPASYRAALAAWRANAPVSDAAIMPRDAVPTSKPRQASIAAQCRSLLKWRAINSGADWTAANDNSAVEDDEGESARAPLMLLDSEYEVRPRISEMMAAIKDVEFAPRRHARKGGRGAEHVVAVGGDIERGTTKGQRKRRARESPLPDCVTRLGSLRFSNGHQVERGLMRTALGIVSADVTIPLGGIVDCKRRKARDRFGEAKGAAANDNTPTVGSNPTAASPAYAFNDPVAAAREAAELREAVGQDTAELLDLAMYAANLRELGEHLGFKGKHAERQGKAALLAACANLDLALAA